MSRGRLYLQVHIDYISVTLALFHMLDKFLLIISYLLRAHFIIHCQFNLYVLLCYSVNKLIQFQSLLYHFIPSTISFWHSATNRGNFTMKPVTIILKTKNNTFII